MIYDNITQTIGKTPIVKIQRLAPAHVTIYVKVESFNPGASVKDRLAIGIIEDADGNRLFSHLDVEALGQKSAKALDRVFSTAMELSGLSDKDVEDMTENLEPGQSGASTSA